jgi:hypothetical protein
MARAKVEVKAFSNSSAINDCLKGGELQLALGLPAQ